MKKIILGLAITLFASGLIAVPARADVDVMVCIEGHTQCISACTEKGIDAGCVAKCAAQEAQCAGGVGLERTVPFIRDAAREIESMFFDLFGDYFPEMIEKRRKLYNPYEASAS